MTEAPPLTDHLIKPPNFDVQASPCGCTVITFPSRCVVAVPCARHAGAMKVTMELATPEDVGLPSISCPYECGFRGWPGSVHHCPTERKRLAEAQRAFRDST